MGIRPLAALLALAGAGCADSGETYRDLPVEIDGEARPEFLTGDPELDAGLTVDGRFVPFEDGGELPIIHGLQGGRWIHLAIRARGELGATGLVTVRLTRDDEAGEVLAEVRGGVRLSPSDAGWLEDPVVQLSVGLGDGEVAALAGATVVLALTYEAGGSSASGRWTLMVVDG